jgi:RNA polymerase sigma-70 factor (ECF subfamily)
VLRLAREGPGEALNELLEGYRNYLRILASTCFHRDLKGKADPSDVVQETLLKVHENFHQFRGATEAEWMAWLRKILVRSLADFQREFARDRRNVAQERSLERLVNHSSAALRSLGPAAGPSPSEQAQRRELGALVADALAGLEPEDRDVVILRNLHELDWRRIGERTGRSPDAARMVWARALHRMGGLLCPTRATPRCRTSTRSIRTI